MKRSRAAFIRLISPIILSILLIAFGVIAPTLVLQASVPLLGPAVSISVPLNNSSAVRLVLFLLAAVCLAIPAFRDYTAYFPTYMKLRVHFNLRGIEDSLGSLSSAEREHLRIDADWHRYHGRYLARLNHLLSEYHKKLQHSLPPYVKFTESTFGSGDFAYRIVSTKGWQEYQLVQGSGYIQYEFYGEGEKLELLHICKLHHTSDSYFNTSLRDIYLRYTKLIHPTVRQYAPTGPLRSVAADDFICATRIRLFPIPRVENTLYLVDRARLDHDDVDDVTLSGWMIPIAYGIYSMD